MDICGSDDIIDDFVVVVVVVVVVIDVGLKSFTVVSSITCPPPFVLLPPVMPIKTRHMIFNSPHKR